MLTMTMLTCFRAGMMSVLINKGTAGYKMIWVVRRDES